MSGILAAAIAGAVGGAGAGASDVGKNMMLEDNLKLKSDLDQQREVRLQEMRNASAADVANIHGDTARDVADTGAAASGYAAETAAGAHEYAADTAAKASGYAADTSATKAVEAAKIHASSYVQAANIHADVQKNLAKNSLQVSNDGTLYRVKNDEDGDPEAVPVLGPDGEPFKVQKNLDSNSAAQIGAVTKLITAQEGVMKSAIGKAAKASAQADLNKLYQRLGDLTGSKFDMGGGAASPGTKPQRPPLSSFEE
jgi:hypothetical protein